jgi:hypothetical protein
VVHGPFTNGGPAWGRWLTKGTGVVFSCWYLMVVSLVAASPRLTATGPPVAVGWFQQIKCSTQRKSLPVSPPRPSRTQQHNMSPNNVKGTEAFFRYLEVDRRWKSAVTILSLVFTVLLLVTAILGWTTYNEPAPAASNRTFFIIMTFLALGGITVAALKVAVDFRPQGASNPNNKDAQAEEVAAKLVLADQVVAAAQLAAAQVAAAQLAAAQVAAAKVAADMRMLQ